MGGSVCCPQQKALYCAQLQEMKSSAFSPCHQLCKFHCPCALQWGWTKQLWSISVLLKENLFSCLMLSYPGLSVFLLAAGLSMLHCLCFSFGLHSRMCQAGFTFNMNSCSAFPVVDSYHSRLSCGLSNAASGTWVTKSSALLEVNQTGMYLFFSGCKGKFEMHSRIFLEAVQGATESRSQEAFYQVRI